MWACKYIMEELTVPSSEEMIADSKKWLKKFSEMDITKFIDVVQLLTEQLKDIFEDSGYPTTFLKASTILYNLYQHKAEDILTYRDRQFRSVYTANLASLHHTPWMENFDETLESFGLDPLSRK